MPHEDGLDVDIEADLAGLPATRRNTKSPGPEGQGLS
jgi:hypothetical protein